MQIYPFLAYFRFCLALFTIRVLAGWKREPFCDKDRNRIFHCENWIIVPVHCFSWIYVRTGDVTFVTSACRQPSSSWIYYPKSGNLIWELPQEAKKLFSCKEAISQTRARQLNNTVDLYLISWARLARQALSIFLQSPCSYSSYILVDSHFRSHTSPTILLVVSTRPAHSLRRSWRYCFCWKTYWILHRKKRYSRSHSLVYELEQYGYN